MYRCDPRYLASIQAESEAERVAQNRIRSMLELRPPTVPKITLDMPGPAAFVAPLAIVALALLIILLKYIS